MKTILEELSWKDLDLEVYLRILKQHPKLSKGDIIVHIDRSKEETVYSFGQVTHISTTNAFTIAWYWGSQTKRVFTTEELKELYLWDKLRIFRQLRHIDWKN